TSSRPGSSSASRTATTWAPRRSSARSRPVRSSAPSAPRPPRRWRRSRFCACTADRELNSLREMKLPRYRTGDDALDAEIAALVEQVSEPGDADLIFELVASAWRLARDSADRGDLKIANAALKEMRHAFHVFAPYRAAPKVAIFGSARTRPDDSLYVLARDVAAALAERDWMVITGAGPGIMEA